MCGSCARTVDTSQSLAVMLLFAEPLSMPAHCSSTCGHQRVTCCTWRRLTQADWCLSLEVCVKWITVEA